MQEQPQPQQQQSNQPPQKTEYLSRADIRTMEKDVARFREQETRQERERISQLQTQDEFVREKDEAERIRKMALARKLQLEKEQEQQEKREEQARSEQQKRGEERKKAEEQRFAQQRAHDEEMRVQQELQKQSIIPPLQIPPKAQEPLLPKGPSPISRVLVRLFVVILVAFIIFNLVLFGYWQLQKRDIEPFSFLHQLPFFTSRGTPTPQPQQSPGATPSPVPAPSPAFLGEERFEKTATLQFQTSQELRGLLETLKTQPREPGFLRLILQSTGSRKSLNAGGFFDLFEISSASSLLAQFQNETLFFFYADDSRSRFGFVVRVENPEETRQLLLAWEGSLEADLQPLSSFWGKKGKGYTTLFRQKEHRGIPLRFQTFSLQDEGIVYALVNNSLILASSFESTKAVIDIILNSQP